MTDPTKIDRDPDDSGNYTEEREELFADLTLDDILAEVKKSRSAEVAD